MSPVLFASLWGGYRRSSTSAFDIICAPRCVWRHGVVASSQAFPEDGGYSIWVTEAFGEFWGIQESYWSWTSGVIDTAVYPVLILSTAQSMYPALKALAGWQQCVTSAHLPSCPPPAYRPPAPATRNIDGASTGHLPPLPLPTMVRPRYLIKLALAALFTLPPMLTARLWSR